jgi:hypothetical protein
MQLDKTLLAYEIDLQAERKSPSISRPSWHTCRAFAEQ